jgi:hypothetical protein
MVMTMHPRRPQFTLQASTRSTVLPLLVPVLKHRANFFLESLLVPSPLPLFVMIIYLKNTAPSSAGLPVRESYSYYGINSYMIHSVITFACCGSGSLCVRVNDRTSRMSVENHRVLTMES